MSELDGESSKVLLVDDEAFIRELATRILEAAGYRVVGCENGDDALHQYRECAKEITCIVLDLSLGGESGEHVLSAVREADADLPVIITSGLAEQEILERVERDPHTHFLQKPFRPAELVEAVRDFS